MSSRTIILFLGLIILLFSVAAWTVVSSQASAPATAVVPLHLLPYAQAEIPKPTYTPLPTAISSPIPPPANESESVAQAVIVDSSQGNFAAETSPVNYSGGKKILVDISEQHMYVFDGEQLVYSFVSSTGMNNATRTGSFSILDKIPNAYGATWNIWMPNWLGIYYAGSLENGIHALPILSNGTTLWSGYLGNPVSFGCVVLDTTDAQILYDWVEVGVPVEIQR